MTAEHHELLRASICLDTPGLLAYFAPYRPEMGKYVCTYVGLSTDDEEIVKAAIYEAAMNSQQWQQHFRANRDNMSEEITAEEGMEATLESMQVYRLTLETGNGPQEGFRAYMHSHTESMTAWGLTRLIFSTLRPSTDLFGTGYVFKPFHCQICPTPATVGALIESSRAALERERNNIREADKALNAELPQAQASTRGGQVPEAVLTQLCGTAQWRRYLHPVGDYGRQAYTAVVTHLVADGATKGLVPSTSATGGNIPKPEAVTPLWQSTISTTRRLTALAWTFPDPERLLDLLLVTAPMTDPESQAAEAQMGALWRDGNWEISLDEGKPKLRQD
ncbi:hypothetical protein C8F01DRAFT_1250503 [Mycena amicta]|nr:hypothetical protein C8F01DRAFT_1250503 [Mycena amicta]